MAGGSKSKNKGNTFERDLAKILTEIFEGSFLRSLSGSGAYLGRSNSHRKATMSKGQIMNAKGDITPPDHMPRFVVEAKNYESLAFHQLMSVGRCAQLDGWIKQCIETIDPGDAYFVCFKISRTGTFVVVPDLDQGYSFKNHCTYANEFGKYHITDLVQFFTNNKEIVLKLSA